MSFNSYNITKMSLVYGLFNQYIFTEAKSNIDLIERYYMSDPTTMDNTLIRAFIDTIRKYDFESIDEPVFKSILAIEKKTDAEATDILSEIVKYKMYDSKQIEPLRTHLRSICYQAMINYANGRFKSDPQGFVNYLKTADYHADYSNVLSTRNFNDLVISPSDQSVTGGWASTLNMINESYKPLYKYKTGQIVGITAPPGCFLGSTKVRLIDGTSITMEELSDRVLTEDFYTYCRHSDGSTHPTRIRTCWVSKNTDKLVKVTYDNGDSDICTPDHKFLLKDGSYRQASDLTPGTSLSSDWRFNEYYLSDLYDTPENYQNYLNLPGYLIYKITNLVTGKSYIGDTRKNLRWKLFDHYCGAHFDLYDDEEINIHLYNSMRKYGLDNFTIRILTFDESMTEEYYIAKYDSFYSGYNNSTTGKGWIYGSSVATKVVINDGTTNKYVKLSDLDYWESLGWIKGRLFTSLTGRVNIMKGDLLKKVPKDSLDYWISQGWVVGTPEYITQKRSLKMSTNKTGFYNPEVSSRAGRISAELNRSNGTNIFDPEIRRLGQLSGLESQKIHGTGIYNKDPKSMKSRSERAIATNSKNKSGSCHNPELQKICRDLATKASLGKRFLVGVRILDELYSNSIPITEESYESLRVKEVNPSSTTLKWSKLVSRLTQDQLIKYGLDNHKVVSVETISIGIHKVYDLNVEDESHNFMLDSEVFVKNCGKTLFLMNEELSFCLQGARVHHIALGDMKESDFILRMAAIYSGLPFDQVTTSIQIHLQNLKQAIGDRLSLTCVPAAMITADQYIEYMRPQLDNYDVLVIDYDTRL